MLSTVTSGFCASGLLVQSSDQPLVLRVLQWVVARRPEQGALYCVDAVVNGEESHEKYLNHEAVCRYVDIRTSGSLCPSMNRLGQYVASKKTMRVRGKVWSEIFDALEKARPDIKSIVAFQNEALSITRTRK